MPLMGSLYIGTSGLQTSQNALNTTAHNMGVFLANTIACSMRAAVAYWRIYIPKWGMKNL